jgi:hypothetical protein
MNLNTNILGLVGKANKERGRESSKEVQSLEEPLTGDDDFASRKEMDEAWASSSCGVVPSFFTCVFTWELEHESIPSLTKYMGQLLSKGMFD